MQNNDYIIFDIGANWGQDSLERCKLNPNVKVWAFEPTPQLVEYLIQSSQDFRDRYTVVPIAVENFD